MNLLRNLYTRRLYFGAILLTVILFACLASVLYLLSGGGQLFPVHIVTYSLIFSTFSLAAWGIITGQIKKIAILLRRDNIMVVGIMGLLSPFSYFLVISNAFAILGKVGRVDEAYVLNATWPVLMVFFSIVLNKDKPTLGNLSALLLGFIGIVTILTNGNFSRLALSNIKGDLLAVSAAVIFGLYSTLLGSQKLKDLFQEVGPVIAVLGFQIVSLICSLFVLVVTVVPVKPSLVQLLLLAISGAGCFGLAYVALYYARSHLPTSTVGVFMLIVPFLSLFLLRIVSKSPSIQSYWMGLLMIGGGILAQTTLSVLSERS